MRNGTNESNAEEQLQLELRSSKDSKKSEKKARSKKRKMENLEYLGWASKPLIDFLSYIGRDPSICLSREEVASVVLRYGEEHNLFDLKKKKKLLCDSRLKSLFGRDYVKKRKISKLLKVHFAKKIKIIIYRSKEGENNNVVSQSMMERMDDTTGS